MPPVDQVVIKYWICLWFRNELKSTLKMRTVITLWWERPLIVKVNCSRPLSFLRTFLSLSFLSLIMNNLTLQLCLLLLKIFLITNILQALSKGTHCLLNHKVLRISRQIFLKFNSHSNNSKYKIFLIEGTVS
jgi:hypothetical protein